MIGFPKGTPRVILKAKRKAALEAQDRAARKACRLRSGGRCEVVTETPKPETSTMLVKRCQRRATQNHHLMGGNGRRNRRESVLSNSRLDCCSTCHQLITARVLEPSNRDHAMLADKVRYRYHAGSEL